MHNFKDSRNVIYIKRKKTRWDLEKINFSIYLSNTFSGILSCVFMVNWLFSYILESLFIKYNCRNIPKYTGNLQNSFRMP